MNLEKILVKIESIHVVSLQHHFELGRGVFQDDLWGVREEGGKREGEEEERKKREEGKR